MRINISGLNDIRPHLNNAKESIKSASQSAVAISVPSDFDEAESVRKILSTINGLLSEVEGITSSVVDMIKLINNAESASNAVAQSILEIMPGYKADSKDVLGHIKNKAFDMHDSLHEFMFGFGNHSTTKEAKEKIKDTSETFKKLGTYGMDQGYFYYPMDVSDDIFVKFIKEQTKYADILYNKFGIYGSGDNFFLLDNLDSFGACAYAANANLIFDTYKNNPAKFKKDFGYPLYVDSYKGGKIFNPTLTLDMYIFYNTNTSSINVYGKDALILEGKDGKLRINKKHMDEESYGWKRDEKHDAGKYQLIAGRIYDMKTTDINRLNEFLGSKNIDYKYNQVDAYHFEHYKDGSAQFKSDKFSKYNTNMPAGAIKNNVQDHITKNEKVLLTVR